MYGILVSISGIKINKTKVFVDFVLRVWLYMYVYECVCVYWCIYDKVLVHR